MTRAAHEFDRVHDFLSRQNLHVKIPDVASVLLLECRHYTETVDKSTVLILSTSF